MPPTQLPNITPAQVVAVVSSVVTQAIAYGLLDPHTGQFVVSLAGIVIPSAWMLADAIIRHGRSRALAPAPVVASSHPATVPPAS